MWIVCNVHVVNSMYVHTYMFMCACGWLFAKGRCCIPLLDIQSQKGSFSCIVFPVDFLAGLEVIVTPSTLRSKEKWLYHSSCIIVTHACCYSHHQLLPFFCSLQKSCESWFSTKGKKRAHPLNWPDLVMTSSRGFRVLNLKSSPVSEQP